MDVTQQLAQNMEVSKQISGIVKCSHLILRCLHESLYNVNFERVCNVKDIEHNP